MNNYGDILGSFLKRLIPAAIFGAIGWRILSTAEGGFAEAAGQLLLAMASFLTATIIMASPLIRLLVEPLGGIFSPDRRFDRPQPMYGIPRSQRAKGHYEEAIAGFEKIARDFPGELQPFVEMIEIAVINLKDPKRAQAIFFRGLTELRKEEDKLALKKIYDATLTRLQSQPEWLKNHQKKALILPDLKNQDPVDEPDGLTARRFHVGGEVPHEGKK